MQNKKSSYIFLYFEKWNFLALILRNYLYFLIFCEMETPKKFFIFCEVTFQAQKVSCISGRTSKAPEAKTYYISPKKVINKFFPKHFHITVSIFSINWIKHYWYIKHWKLSFVLNLFSSFRYFLLYISSLLIFYYITNLFPTCHIIIKICSIFYNKIHTFSLIRISFIYTHFRKEYT